MFMVCCACESTLQENRQARQFHALVSEHDLTLDDAVSHSMQAQHDIVYMRFFPGSIECAISIIEYSQFACDAATPGLQRHWCDALDPLTHAGNCLNRTGTGSPTAEVRTQVQNYLIVGWCDSANSSTFEPVQHLCFCTNISR